MFISNNEFSGDLNTRLSQVFKWLKIEILELLTEYGVWNVRYSNGALNSGQFSIRLSDYVLPFEYWTSPLFRSTLYFTQKH